MKLSDKDVTQLVQLGSLATTLMDAATSSSALVGEEANGLASRLIAMATDLTKEPEPVKSSSPLMITEEQLADAISHGHFRQMDAPAGIARQIFATIHPQPPQGR